MAGYIQSNQIVLVPNIASYAVSVADTGKIFILPQTTVGVGAIAITLPAIASGLHYRFFNGSAAISAAANNCSNGGNYLRPNGSRANKWCIINCSYGFNYHYTC